MSMKDKVIVALDVSSQDQAMTLIDQLHDVVGYFKIGMQLYYACGNSFISKVQEQGGKVFLDLKMHDIPNTVYCAAQEIAKLGVGMTNFHAAGGMEMLTYGVKGLREAPGNPPLAIGVTVMTSLDNGILNKELGIPMSTRETVAKWAKLCLESGLDGVVCSPQEITIVKEACGKDFLTVTPGIRPGWSGANDQRRITTPAQAVALGGDYLVIGRPITAAENPRQAVLKILEEMDAAYN